MAEGMADLPDHPDVVATSGWARVGAGYWGIASETITRTSGRFCGAPVERFSSSHERAHIMAAYGLSPFEQGCPCYVLVWEGIFGTFYYVDERVEVTRIGTPLLGPGYRYALACSIGVSEAPGFGGELHLAGKLMALAAFGAEFPDDDALQQDIDALLRMPVTRGEHPEQNILIDFAERPWSFRRAGWESTRFRSLARRLQDAIFDIFLRFAQTHLRGGLPLLISGGCGLNCMWNSQWRDCGLFSEVFIPPCCNDSGAAIGTAIDAQFQYTGNAKITWNVQAGPSFVRDCPSVPGFALKVFDCFDVARRLAGGDVFAWVQGRAEIGPRALGARSILCAPFRKASHERLNAIKNREAFRPIAPVCLEEDAVRWFMPAGTSPFMTFVTRVTDTRLEAVTHVDGTARLQTLCRSYDGRLRDLLVAFRQITGYSVLANTSLNFSGLGCVNRMSDVARFARKNKLDGIVVDDLMYCADLGASG